MGTATSVQQPRGERGAAAEWTTEQLAVRVEEKCAARPVRLSFLRPSLALPKHESAEHLHSHMAKVLGNDEDLADFAGFLMRAFAEEPLQFYMAVDDFASKHGTRAERASLVAWRSRRRSTLAAVAAAAPAAPEGGAPEAPETAF